MDSKPFRHLYPFQSQHLEINGFRYHYIDEGFGEPIVMVHGNPTWSFYFRKLIQSLSSGYRTIAPDHIGCGLSEKPESNRYGYRLQNRVYDLSVLLDRLELQEKITLVLHDWGGMIGMTFAVKYPERIGRIVLLNTAAFLPPKNKPLPMRLRLVRNSGIVGTFCVLYLNLFALGAAWMAPHQRLSREVRKGLIAPYNSRLHRVATLKFVRDIPMNEKDPSFRLVQHVDKRLQTLSTHPMLICWGEHDFVFDGDYLSEWQRRFPDAEVHVFPEAGHYILEDVPEKITFRIKAFLGKHPL